MFGVIVLCVKLYNPIIFISVITNHYNLYYYLHYYKLTCLCSQMLKKKKQERLARDLDVYHYTSFTSLQRQML